MNFLCEGCSDERPFNAHAQGWRGRFCRSCYRRWSAAGYPVDGPPYPVKPTGPRVYRLEEYADLRERHLSIAEASRRVGVHKRTGERYERDLRRAA